MVKRTSKTAVLLLTGVLVLTGAAAIQAARYCGTFSIARHPIVVDKSKLHSNVKAGAPGARDRVLALVDGSFSPDALANAGWRVISQVGEVATLEGDPATGPYLGALQGVRHVQKPGRVYPQLDSARRFTNVDQVHETRPGGISRTLTGKKVLIGFIDTEFDTRHPAFLDSNGAIRFVAIWDQAAKYSTAFPNKYHYGVIKNNSQILADSLFGLDSNDVHGSMTASLAAGSDKRYWKGPPENAYYGVAPDALLAGVKMGGTDVNIVDGLHWLDSLAKSLNLPYVINMSLGSHNGPHDGKSAVDRAIDAISTAGHIVVGAAGNDGDKRAHLAFSMTEKESKGTWITPVPWSSTMWYSGIEMWGDSGTEFTARFYILDTVQPNDYKQSLQSISTATNRQNDPDTVIWLNATTLKRDTVVFYIGTEASSALNGKPHIQAQATCTNPGLYVGVSVLDSGTTSNTVHAWNLAKVSLESFGISGFFNGDSTYSVNELGGTAKHNITVGAYASKAVIPLWNGTFKDWGKDTSKPPHSLTSYSSQGPTADGRIKPDITAPGSDVTCALSRAYKGEGDIVVWPDTTSLAGRYISTGGTSVAAPIVAGIVALLLEADPSLTNDRVRQLLRETAINDTATGIIGANYNNRYGAGKVNAIAAAAKLLGVNRVGNSVVANMNRPRFSITKLPGNRLRLFSASDQQISGTMLEVYSINGRCVAKYALAKDGITTGSLGELSKGYYMVRAAREDKTLCSTAITIVD
jgi:minor extracellular serine protease Vpr